MLAFGSPQCRTLPSQPWEAFRSGDHPAPWAAPRHQAGSTGLGQLSPESGGQETQQIRACELCAAATSVLLALELTGSWFCLGFVAVCGINPPLEQICLSSSVNGNLI